MDALSDQGKTPNCTGAPCCECTVNVSSNQILALACQKIARLILTVLLFPHNPKYPPRLGLYDILQNVHQWDVLPTSKLQSI